MAALVILAAGESRRLGTPKALVRLREAEPSTPLSMLLAAGSPFFQQAPLVIAGAHFEETRSRLDPSVELAENRLWKAGRSGGIALASTLRPDTDLCLAPVDVPAVEACVFERLARTWTHAGAPARGWLAPFWTDGQGEKHFGHPLICGRELLAQLARAPGDMPLRELRPRARPLLSCPVESDSILDDLDTPADLEAVRRRFR